MFRNSILAAAAALTFAGPAWSAPSATAVATHAYVAAHEKAIVADFVDLLSLPDVATIVPDVERNAAALSAQLARRGFRTRILAAAPGTPPSVFGEFRVKGARRTVVFYAHYDGQPVAQPDWASAPFTPVMRSGPLGAGGQDVDWRAAQRIDPEWRLYARGASDDKASIQALLSAFDALKAAGRKPSVNVKVLWEGEEEQGSGHLGAILAANRQLLSGDLMILGDGPRHPTGEMQVGFGARGVASVDLTVFGPLRPLHDGHYGNWAPNPAAMLVRLLASLRDDEGRILIPGFYDDVRPVTPQEHAALDALPDVETPLARELGLGRTEGRERLADSLMRPALNIRGLRVGGVGDAATNAISTQAQASIDFRLVPGETPQGARRLTEDFLRAQGWTVVDHEPDLAIRLAHPRIVMAAWSLDYPAYRTDLTAPESKAVVAAIERSLGRPIIRIPQMGGSVPMAVIADKLGLPIVGVPIANYDNNQHAANENLRMANLWEAVDIYAGLLGDLTW